MTKVGCLPRFAPPNGSGVCFGSRFRLYSLSSGFGNENHPVRCLNSCNPGENTFERATRGSARQLLQHPVGGSCSGPALPALSRCGESFTGWRCVGFKIDTNIILSRGKLCGECGERSPWTAREGLREDAERAELRAAAAAQVLGRRGVELVEGLAQRLAEQPGGP